MKSMPYLLCNYTIGDDKLLVLFWVFNGFLLKRPLLGLKLFRYTQARVDFISRLLEIMWVSRPISQNEADSQPIFPIPDSFHFENYVLRETCLLKQIEPQVANLINYAGALIQDINHKFNGNLY